MADIELTAEQQTLADINVEDLGTSEEIAMWLDNQGELGEHCCDECIDTEGGPDSGPDDDLECGDLRGTWEHDGTVHNILTSCESCRCLVTQSRTAIYNRAYQSGEINSLGDNDD